MLTSIVKFMLMKLNLISLGESRRVKAGRQRFESAADGGKLDQQSLKLGNTYEPQYYGIVKKFYFKSNLTSILNIVQALKFSM